MIATSPLRTPGTKDDLLRPEAFAFVRGIARPAAVQLVETHISWVFLLEHDVFKVKKPVHLGFLDFTTAEKRRIACDAEVRLNARLAPQVYRGVVPITIGSDGHARVDGDGRVVDWAVHMVRVPDRFRADHMLAVNELSPEAVDRIAARLVAFHADCRSDAETARFGSAEVLAANLEENFAQTRRTLDTYLAPAESDELRRWQRATLRGHAARFARRAAAGRVRDGHGDLRLEQIYVAGDELLILDCIEFNERFRFADVCADVAFLSMDLATHGRVDLAEHLLAAYARESNDFDLYSVVDFYESYRAFVRGKVCAMLALDEGAGADARRRAGKDARRFFLKALTADRPPLLMPMVVAIGGVIATGKSTVAERVGAMLSAPVVSSDRTRKSMLHVEATQRLEEPGWSGAYARAVTDDVYREVLRRAEVVLASGRPVVLDASFRSAASRKAAKDLAFRYGAPFRFVECRAEAAVCRARLVTRAMARGVSDGTNAIFDDFAAHYEPVLELPPTEHVVLETSRPLEQSIKTLAAALGSWPARLVG